MLKYMLLIGAAAVSFPAVAQEAPPTGDDPTSQPAPTDPTTDTAPAPDSTTPPAPTEDPAPMPDTSTPPSDTTMPPADTTTPVDPATPADPATTPADPAAPTDPSTPPASDPAASDPAAGGTSATPDQVAQIVNQEFPTYDADATNELNETEFATWMKKLRTATDPTVDPESEQVKSWVGQAFAAADADKSGGVTKEELTGFLSRGA